MCLLLNDKMIMNYRIGGEKKKDNTSYGSSVK